MFSPNLRAYYTFLSTLHYNFVIQIIGNFDEVTTKRAFRSMVDILSTLWSRLILQLRESCR